MPEENIPQQRPIVLLLTGTEFVHVVYTVLFVLFYNDTLRYLMLLNFICMAAIGAAELFSRHITNSKLLVFFIIDITFYSLSSILLTKTTPGTIMLLSSVIPSLILFYDTKTISSQYYVAIVFPIITTLIIEIALQIHYVTPFYTLTGNLKHFYLYSILINIVFVLYEMILGSITMARNLNRIQEETADAEQKIKYSAEHDVLTGLMNRRRISDVLYNCRTAKKNADINYAVSIFDLDDFKKINDTYGHKAGDFILKEFTHTVRTLIPLPAKMGRWGGEEFLIIYPKITKNTIYQLENVRQELSKKIFIFEGREIKMTATFGIASSRHLNSNEKIITDADRCLLDGKNHGKNRVVVSEIY